MKNVKFFFAGEAEAAAAAAAAAAINSAKSNNFFLGKIHLMLRPITGEFLTFSSRQVPFNLCLAFFKGFKPFKNTFNSPFLLSGLSRLCKTSLFPGRRLKLKGFLLT